VIGFWAANTLCNSHWVSWDKTHSTVMQRTSKSLVVRIDIFKQWHSFYAIWMVEFIAISSGTFSKFTLLFRGIHVFFFHFDLSPFSNIRFPFCLFIQNRSWEIRRFLFAYEANCKIILAILADKTIICHFPKLFIVVMLFSRLHSRFFTHTVFIYPTCFDNIFAFRVETSPTVTLTELWTFWSVTVVAQFLENIFLPADWAGSSRSWFFWFFHRIFLFTILFSLGCIYVIVCTTIRVSFIK